MVTVVKCLSLMQRQSLMHYDHQARLQNGIRRNGSMANAKWELARSRITKIIHGHRGTFLLYLLVFFSEHCLKVAEFICALISIISILITFPILQKLIAVLPKATDLFASMGSILSDLTPSLFPTALILIDAIRREFSRLIQQQFKTSHHSMSTKQKRKEEKENKKKAVANFTDVTQGDLNLQCLVKVGIIAQMITITEKFTVSFLLKNDPTFQQTQDYEIPLPYLIMNLDKVFVEELSSAMCALANEEQGGFILIAAKHDGLTIEQGISHFFQEDQEKIQDLVKRAMKPIVPHQNIQVKVEGLCLYPDVWTAFKNEKSEEFVIKISVAPKPGSKKFFYIEHRLKNLKPTYEFFRIDKTKKNQPVHSVQKITETEIYDLMCQVVKHSLKPKTTIWNNTIQNTKLSFKLDYFITQNSKLSKVKFLFNSNQNYHLTSTLQALSYFGEEDICRQFPKIQAKQKVIQVQINERDSLEANIKKIEDFLNQSKTSYRFLVPFQQYQKQLLQFKRDKSPTVDLHYLSYLVLEESYSNFSTGFRNYIGAEFDKQFLINQAKSTFTLGVPLEDYELQAFQNFVWQIFVCIPKTKKLVSTNPNPYYGESGMVLKSVEFDFGKFDFNVAVFSYFVFTLAQKRPH